MSEASNGGGTVRLTIKDIARAAGVSTGAVSYAFNGRPGVAEETRQNIFTVAAKLGWRPSAAARALARARSYCIGLVMSRPAELLESDPFFLRFVAGVESTLSEVGYALLLQVVGASDRRREMESYRGLVAARRLDGVFLTDLRIRDHRCQLLRDWRVPMLGVGRPVRPVAFPWLGPDDGRVVWELVTRLAELGHRRIAYVGGPPTYVHSHHRRHAWRAAVAAAGLRPGIAVAADFTGVGGAQATRRLLAAPVRPTAIVYANDLMAIAGMSVARAAGLAIPDDLSITGFDDIPIARHIAPALTTVREDVVTWGRLAANYLTAEIEGREHSSEPVPAPQLVWRNSAGPPR